MKLFVATSISPSKNSKILFNNLVITVIKFEVGGRVKPRVNVIATLQYMYTKIRVPYRYLLS